MRMRCWHLAQHQAGGTPLVNCPRCIMQYIFSYPPYPGDLLHNLKTEEEPCYGDREPPTFQGLMTLKSGWLPFDSDLVLCWICSLCGKPNKWSNKIIFKINLQDTLFVHWIKLSLYYIQQKTWASSVVLSTVWCPGLWHCAMQSTRTSGRAGRRHVPPKYWHLHTRMQNVITHKSTIWIFTNMKTLNLIWMDG